MEQAFQVVAANAVKREKEEELCAAAFGGRLAAWGADARAPTASRRAGTSPRQWTSMSRGILAERRQTAGTADSHEES